MKKLHSLFVISLFVFSFSLSEPVFSAGETCGGIAGIPCTGINEICDLPPGSCQIADAQGICTVVPTYCLAIYDPVCGCDDITYSNDCYRLQAQVPKQYDGPCQTQTPCQDNNNCQPSDYCAKALGDCGNATGFCEPEPQACPQIYDPVCGCDDITYNNSCQAAMAGVNIASDGECVQVCGGIAGFACVDTNDFCDYSGLPCYTPDAQGICNETPEFCFEIFDPVCGCNGVTYSNDCFRKMAQASKDHDGPCPDVCVDNEDCTIGKFCNKANGDCGGLGICQPIPLACTAEYVPVCGCDGTTYGNSCEAMKAGVNVIHAGPCNLVECVVRPPMDFSGDCRVSLPDFAIFTSFWMDCGLVPASACGP
jgi:hypothetical protein